MLELAKEQERLDRRMRWAQTLLKVVESVEDRQVGAACRVVVEFLEQVKMVADLVWLCWQ